MSIALSKGQVRGARGMLDWSLADLAKAAQVSVSSVKRFETTELDAVSHETAGKIRDALEHQGITFLVDDGTGLGLRLRGLAKAAD
ncbi:helix-turn-helix domain-containing protein [Lichenibacterium ramalinae]|uniref:LacI family DNA-binding transcriptional regulator n=1 Tax=Lichenibacterium ramalinae TaxID=2316527 RepID=A0A4Q2R5G7_9HYPH|nr:LacI family DNA-binding transcriptional regulator [Lichenibacterium ramalinae]RYB01785.1 LacI family DNA-binding transcriptional regulator [Lichenibacterium ramalinae]